MSIPYKLFFLTFETRVALTIVGRHFLFNVKDSMESMDFLACAWYALKYHFYTIKINDFEKFSSVASYQVRTNNNFFMIILRNNLFKVILSSLRDVNFDAMHSSIVMPSLSELKLNLLYTLIII